VPGSNVSDVFGRSRQHLFVKMTGTSRLAARRGALLYRLDVRICINRQSSDLRRQYRSGCYRRLSDLVTEWFDTRHKGAAVTVSSDRIRASTACTLRHASKGTCERC
jgi:hypothetical protein